MDSVFLLDSHDEFQKTIEEIVSSYVSSSTSESQRNSSVESAKEDLKKLLHESNFDVNKLAKLLLHKKWNEEKIAHFVKLLNEKKAELLYASLQNHNSEFGETITNFNWIFKLVLGTSELNSLKYPLLQLVLSIGSNGIQKEILYDVNKDVLVKFIETLENLDEID